VGAIKDCVLPIPVIPLSAAGHEILKIWKWDYFSQGRVVRKTEYTRVLTHPWSTRNQNNLFRFFCSLAGKWDFPGALLFIYFDLKIAHKNLKNR
jgi:hypothetical protein